MTRQGNWNYPTTIRFGSGRLKELAAACHDLGISRPLIVTDPGLRPRAMISEALSICHENGLKADVFSDIKGNPTGQNVADGAACFRANGHDGVIAFGGGSALDAGKAIALIAGQSCQLFDLEDIGDNWRRADTAAIHPIIAVPTTAGTGSEVGRASVITDTDHQVKRIIFHPRLLPAIVIADPALTIGLPGALTAATGMDALSHNLEAFCAPGYHPMARGIAVEGIRLVKEWLPRAYADGTDMDARAEMLTASTMGATAFQRGLGAMHALAHPLGALYDAHHGMLNAVVMPYVLTANRPQIEGPLRYLAGCLALPSATAVIDWVLEIRQTLAIPHQLADLGIDLVQADLIGEMAAVDPSAATNPIAFSAADYRQIFTRAVGGDL